MYALCIRRCEHAGFLCDLRKIKKICAIYKFFNLRSLRKVSRKSRILNRMRCYLYASYVNI